MSAPLHTVHVRVNDAATGQPTPVRIHFSSPTGEYFAPFGRLTEFATTWSQDVGGNLQLKDRKYSYIDGSCEIRLPATPLRVEISKGPEYTPISRQITLGPGKLALRFAMERWTNLPQEGWYSGDCRSHFLSPHGALLEGAAEDLAVVNLLAQECELPTFDVSKAIDGKPLSFGRDVESIPNILAFSGQRAALEIPGHMVVVNTHNHSPLGSLALLNCHRAVYPLSFGIRNRCLDWTLADWCDQCHRKGGLVVWTELLDDVNPVWESEFPILKGQHRERLADLILGKIDAIEVEDNSWHSRVCDETTKLGSEAEWYLFLNAGLRVPLVGSSGKSHNKTALGSVRTYALLGAEVEFTYKNWIEAIRAGRTFVTRGPILQFTVNEQPPGAIVPISEAHATLRVRAEARKSTPIEQLEVVRNGIVTARASGTETARSTVLETEMEVQESCWLAARCTKREEGTDESPVVVAHTSPIYIEFPGFPIRPDLVELNHLVAHLDTAWEFVQSIGRFENDRQRQNLAGIFQSAREELAKRAQSLS